MSSRQVPSPILLALAFLGAACAEPAPAAPPPTAELETQPRCAPPARTSDEVARVELETYRGLRGATRLRAVVERADGQWPYDAVRWQHDRQAGLRRGADWEGALADSVVDDLLDAAAMPTTCAPSVDRWRRHHHHVSARVRITVTFQRSPTLVLHSDGQPWVVATGAFAGVQEEPDRLSQALSAITDRILADSPPLPARGVSEAPPSPLAHDAAFAHPSEPSMAGPVLLAGAFLDAGEGRPFVRRVDVEPGASAVRVPIDRHMLRVAGAAHPSLFRFVSDTGDVKPVEFRSAGEEYVAGGAGARDRFDLERAGGRWSPSRATWIPEGFSSLDLQGSGATPTALANLTLGGRPLFTFSFETRPLGWGSRVRPAREVRPGWWIETNGGALPEESELVVDWLVSAALIRTERSGWLFYGRRDDAFPLPYPPPTPPPPVEADDLEAAPMASLGPPRWTPPGRATPAVVLAADLDSGCNGVSWRPRSIEGLTLSAPTLPDAARPLAIGFRQDREGYLGRGLIQRQIGESDWRGPATTVEVRWESRASADEVGALLGAVEGGLQCRGEAASAPVGGWHRKPWIRVNGGRLSLEIHRDGRGGFILLDGGTGRAWILEDAGFGRALRDFVDRHAGPGLERWRRSTAECMPPLGEQVQVRAAIIRGPALPARVELTRSGGRFLVASDSHAPAVSADAVDAVVNALRSGVLCGDTAATPVSGGDRDRHPGLPAALVALELTDGRTIVSRSWEPSLRRWEVELAGFQGVLEGGAASEAIDALLGAASPRP